MKVVVIGAGIIGASIAYRLSQRASVEVTVLEAGEAGQGCSGHSFAWTNAFSKRPRHYHDFNRRSADMWHRFVTDLGIPEAFASQGNLILENTREGAVRLQAQVAELQAWGYPSRLINEQELAALEPELAKHEFTAASFSPQEGQVDVLAAIRACLSHAKANGATVREHCGPVTLQRDDSTVATVTMQGGVVEADVVVVAAGTETPALMAPMGVNIPQGVSPGIVIRTDPQPRLLKSVSLVHLPAIDARRMEVHVRQLPDGTLHMGQGTQESLDMDDSQAHADDLLGRAAHYFPVLKDARAIAQPVGYRPMPIDGLPVLGRPPAAPGTYVAMMHSGVTLAPLVGELVMLELVDGVTVDWLEPYRPQRFE